MMGTIVNGECGSALMIMVNTDRVIVVVVVVIVVVIVI